MILEDRKLDFPEISIHTNIVQFTGLMLEWPVIRPKYTLYTLDVPSLYMYLVDFDTVFISYLVS